VGHHSLPLMNSLNKTETAVFSCRLCFLRAFPFISLININGGDVQRKNVVNNVAELYYDRKCPFKL